ncbi:MAG: hypothetical protein N3D84_02710 [Candidatus Woesearchaeota archaeon]|nr:hypothetical protein [Candidatus Woesearchaeota archaeon]
MTITTKDLEKMLNEIKFNGEMYYELIMPLAANGLNVKGNIISNNNHKRSNAFVVLQTIKKLREIINKYYSLEFFNNSSKIFDSRCPLSTSIENAYNRGNLKQSYPLSVKLFFGDNGFILRVRDSGNGFDFNETQRKYERKERYFCGGGAGFRSYNNSLAEVSFEGNGNIINIMYIIKK